MAVEYEGARYYRQFIKQLRNLEDGRLEDLEEGEYDIYVDKKLGLKLYHSGVGRPSGPRRRLTSRRSTPAIRTTIDTSSTSSS
jgi:hypothetical protein